MLNRDQIAHEYMLTLISRDNAKLQNGFQAFAVDAFNAADAMIAEAEKRTDTERPSVVGDGWISVEDRLPDDGAVVLVYISDQDIMLDSYPFSFTGETTHWQPLPNLPKEVK